MGGILAHFAPSWIIDCRGRSVFGVSTAFSVPSILVTIKLIGGKSMYSCVDTKQDKKFLLELLTLQLIKLYKLFWHFLLFLLAIHLKVVFGVFFLKQSFKNSCSRPTLQTTAISAAFPPWECELFRIDSFLSAKCRKLLNFSPRISMLFRMFYCQVHTIRIYNNDTSVARWYVLVYRNYFFSFFGILLITRTHFREQS